MPQNAQCSILPATDPRHKPQLQVRATSAHKRSAEQPEIPSIMERLDLLKDDRNLGAGTDTSSTAEEDSEAELLEIMQLVEASQKNMLAERRMLEFDRDGLSVEAGSNTSGRMEDVEFRLQKDTWLVISRFFEEQLGLPALGLVKAMTQ